jgi:hypothetical protein
MRNIIEIDFLTLAYNLDIRLQIRPSNVLIILQHTIKISFIDIDNNRSFYHLRLRFSYY